MEKGNEGKLEDLEELTVQILAAIKSIRFGYVQIIIQDSKVVQIDKTEKIRVPNN